MSQTELRDTARAMLVRCPTDIDGSWAPLWTQLEGAGLTSIGVPEHLGGSGGTLSDAATVVRAIAEGGRDLPLADTMLIAGQACARAGLPMPPGPVAVAADLVPLSARTSADGGIVLSGVVRAVPWAGQARSLLVLADCEGTIRLAVIDAVTVARESRPFAAHPVGDLEFNDVVVPAAWTAAWPGSVGDLLALGALARAVQMLGAVQAVLTLSTTHVTTREQFGRPLSRFQAVQHLLAELGAESALLEAVVEGALQPGERAGIDRTAAAAAKACAGAAAAVASHVGHQVHGAIGFTDEYPLSGFTRSLWAWRDEYGDEHYWSQEMLTDLTSDPAGLWPALCRLGEG